MEGRLGASSYICISFPHHLLAPMYHRQNCNGQCREQPSPDARARAELRKTVIGWG